MKLKSSKPTCHFNHATLLVLVCRALLLKSVCQTISQSTITHNTPTYYSNAHNRLGIKVNFFLGEVVLWYSIYVLLAQIRTTWVVSTHLFTYALIATTKRGKFSISKKNTYSIKIRNLVDSKFRWKSVELSKHEIFFTPLDKIQMTLKSSHKDTRTTILVLRCKRKATQLEAHSIYKSLLGTKPFSNETKNYLCLSI